MRHASTRRLPPFSSFFRGDKLALRRIGISIHPLDLDLKNSGLLGVPNGVLFTSSEQRLANEKERIQKFTELVLAQELSSHGYRNFLSLWQYLPLLTACSVGWFVSLLVRLRERVVLLAGSLLQ